MSLHIVLGDWTGLREDASRVRTAVFIAEQGIRAEDEWDAADAEAVHAVAYDGAGAAIGTARLLPDASIGRVAVLRAERHKGVGSMLLEALVAVAGSRGLQEVTLSAQRSAVAFYARHGFVPVGEPYLEVGIEHVGMRRPLEAGA